jgi:hypothetical protein
VRYNQRFLEVKQELMEATMKKKRIVYFDQLHFTNRADLKLEYSNVGTNINIVREKIML